MKHTIPIPIYNGILYLVDTDDIQSTLKELNGDDHNEEDTTAACLIYDHDKDPGAWYLCIDLKQSNTGALVHELFHATHRILEYFDVKFSSTNHEPFAYLIEYLFNECIKLKSE